jgi:hypothetical protein
MIVLLDEPKNEKWGSEAAAPIFSAIGREALRYLNVAPRDSSPVPIVRGEMAAVAPARPRSSAPAAPQPGPPLVTAGASDPADGAPVMPRVAGLSLRQALEALAPLGVGLEIAGRGVVTAQSPLPGAPVPAGTTCRLQLAPPVGRTMTAVPASFRP